MTCVDRRARGPFREVPGAHTFSAELRVFTSQGQAKRFFVDRIVAQAVTEGKPLSGDEQQMLSFSESDPEFEVDPALVERLQSEISDDAYEAKVAGLLEASVEHDVASDVTARDRYRDAAAVLDQGDHYVMVMIDRALGRALRPWWAFWR
jgi:hypothetical protein